MVSNNNFIYTYSIRINLFLPNEMIVKKYNSILIIIFLLLSLSLISAYLIEYGLGHKPCKLCLYQRYPYYISILLLTSIFLLKKNIKIHYLILSVVSLLGAIIAFYHFGIEQGFFNEAAVCETKNFSHQILSSLFMKSLVQEARISSISIENLLQWTQLFRERSPLFAKIELHLLLLKMSQ